MITFEEQLQQTENDNSIIGKKSPKVQTLSDVANTGVYSANDWIELPETKATSGEIIREGLRASQYQLNKIPTELKATMGQAMMSPESVLKIIPFTSMPTMITEQAKVKIFGGTKEADFTDFTGKTRVKQIGKELVQAAYRELKEKDKQYAQRATPLTEEEADTWKYGIASGIGNYGPMLAIGYLTGGVGALSFAVAQEAGQKTEEKLDYYTQKTGDTELKGYTGKQAGKDLALTSVYTAGMGIMEKYIGIGKQMKLFKMSGGEYLKNIALTTLSEGLTEGLEDLYASGIDLVGGYIDTSKLPERYMQAVKSAVIGGLLGGTAGIGTAMAHRSQAKLILRKQYEKTIPAKDIDKVVNAIYDSTADTLQKVVATELVNSESLRNKHGELYNSLKREISNQIKESGAYSDVDEMKLSQYIEGTAKMFADQVLGEANKRGVVIDEVLKSSEIAYKDGRLYLQSVTQDEKAKKTKRKKIQKMIEKQAESILNPRETELSYEEIVRKLRYEDLTAEQETNLQEMLKNEEDRLRPLLDTAQDVALEIDNNFGLQLGDIASVITEKKLNFKEAQDLWGDYLPYNDLRILGEKIKERDNKDGDPVKIGYDYYTEKVYDAFDDINAKANNYILLQKSFDVADENARLDDIYPEYKGETITINGKERTVYNSEGQRIAKSKEALENFYKWFGDSKVVDEQGRPLVVYHNSGAPREVLSREYARTSIEIQGVFFAPQSDPYQEYGPYEHEVYLKIENPADWKTAYQEHGIKLGEREDSGIKVREWLQDKGYDGVMLYEDGQLYELIAFESNQIKSTQNRGTYSESENIYYQFAGEKAQTADLDELNRAKQLEDDGVDNEEIRQQTGWFKGVDGKWRFEISDKDAMVDLSVWRQTSRETARAIDKQIDYYNAEMRRLIKKRDSGDMTQADFEKAYNEAMRLRMEAVDKLHNGKLTPAVKLSDVLQHDTLYAAYPELANLKLSFVFFDNFHKMGSYRDDVLYLNEELQDNPKELKSVLMHEIQHAIQRKESFAVGGSPDMAQRLMDTLGLTADIKIEEEKRKYFMSILNNAEKVQDILNKQYFYNKSFKELMENPNSEKLKEQAEDWNNQYFDTLKKYGISKEQLALSNNTTTKKLVSFLKKATPHEVYERLLGEVEARNTQARINMSEEERAATSPESTQDVKNADAIVVFDDGTAMAYEPETYYQSAFAGSRVDYDRPSLEAIGSGEGAQAHGWGLYYALNRDVAERYRETFTKGQSKLIIGDKSIEELINSYDWNNEDYDIADNMIDEIIRHLEFRAKNQKDTYEARQSVLQDIGNYIQDLRGYLKKGSDDEVYIKHVKEDLENAEKLRDKIATYNAKEFKFEEQKGQVHEVDIPENPYLLDEELQINQQSETVRKAVRAIMNQYEDYYIASDDYSVGAFGDALTGERFYKQLMNIAARNGIDSKNKQMQFATQTLEKYGIKGITYDGRQDGRCFVIFNPEDVKVIQKFYQINHLPKSKKEIIKGSFDALTKSIKITSDADFSTYQHEFAHFWLDNMFNYAHSDLASENYKKDFKAIEKWLKYDDTRQSYFTRQQHEQFARGYEKFLYKGEVANPIIGKAYNDYENFIREVYSSITEIDTKAGYKKYKAVPAKVYEFFNNMVRGELPNYGAEVDPKAVVKKEVEDTKTVIAERNKVIAENKKNYDLPPVKTDNTSGYMSETANPKNIKPIENIEDKSVLTAYAKTMGEDVEAGRANLAKDYATATEFVNKNPELAGQIVRGEVEAPTGMLKNSIYMAYNELQKKLGNTKNRAESALNQALELRRYGQEIASQRLAYMSEINPEYWIGRILTSKASQLAKENRMSVDKLNTTIKEAIESGMAENKTPQEIAKELREELGVTELYQTEIAPKEDTKSPSYNYIYKYVNEQLGLGMKEADAMEILRRTDDMWANIENSKAETGNPSIEYFEKLKALEDFANTLAPSSNLRVFVSVISPGSLLLNIKSSLTNIISNLPTGLMRAAVRRIRLGQMTSLVSPEKIALNKHYVWEVFAKTGYNITDMTELTPESKYHGEEITHSQGKGALRALGRWYEKVVYKWSLGAGDIFYKNLAFNDYASLLATKLANGDAKVANDLFDDAIRIEPLTQYGKAIRRMARDEALIATYQNDTALSKSAMKLRDATDFGVGLSKFFIPFVKTPANVIDLGLKTGFGSFKAIVSEVHRDMKAGKILKPTKENIELFIENGLGFALGFALSSMFDDDDYMPAYSMASAKDKQLAKELNIPFNSVRIGDTWFNLDYLGPLAVPLVGILNARREKDIIEKIGAFGKAGLMQIAALPAFGEIDDLMQKIEQYQHKGVKESAEQFVDNLGETIYSRIVPSIVNDVAKVLDGYDRERKGNEIITQIPFARENAPLKYNVTSGRPEEINQWWGIFTGARVKTQVVNSVAREFERLNNTGNGISLTPVTRSGLLSSLSDNKKQQVNKEFAKEYAKQVSALIKTYKYKNSNDEDKKDMIDKIRRKIVKELKQEYLQK